MTPENIKCIWCKRSDRKPSIEHIIPEALGCPSEFVLKRGEVCCKCNNHLAQLDQAVIDDLDFLAYMNGIPRKRGRAPEIRSRGNVIGTYESGQPSVFINMESHPIMTHLGDRLGAYGRSARNVNTAMEKIGDFAKISFGIEIGKNPKFARGLVKIAFSSLAWYIGAGSLAHDAFNPVRRFVTKGDGFRPIILCTDGDHSYRNQVWGPYRSPEGYYSMTFRLSSFHVWVDLSPECTSFPTIRDAMFNEYGETGWSCLPLSAAQPRK